MGNFEMYFSAAILLVFFLIGFFLQEMSSRAIFFGVRIPLGYEKNSILMGFKKEYRKNFTVSYLVFMLVYFLLMASFKDYFATILVIGAFSFVAVLNVNYYIIYKKVKELKSKEKWKLDTERVIVVDTKFREKDDNNKRLVISPWWFLVPLFVILITVICILAAYPSLLSRNPVHINQLGQVDRWEDKNYSSFIPMIMIQLGLTLLFFIVYKLIEKAKQQLNGGEINEIRRQSRNFRYISSVLFLFISTIININFLFITLTMIGWVRFSGRNTLLFLISLCFVPILVFIVVFVLMGQGGRNLKISGDTQGDKLVINRDDDDYYFMGTMYYNKYDPALIVEKRMSAGWDFNYAKPAARVIMGLIAVLVVFVVFITTQLPGLIKEREIQVTSDNVAVSGMWGINVKTENIDKITLEKEIPVITMRTNGAAVGNKLFGKFTLRDYNKSTLFIEDKTKPFVAIYLKDKSLLLINYEKDKRTEEFYKKITDDLKIK